MSLVSIIGSGRIGSTAAFVMAIKGLADIRLIDIVEKIPQGEALDIMHGAASGFGVSAMGTNDFSEMKGSDIVINTAGMARKPGMDRLDLLNKNVQIVSSVAENIKKHAPDSMVIQVSNPVDIMNYVMKTVTGFPRKRVFGMGGMLDSQRFSLHLANALGAKLWEVKAMVIGEHGESQVPLFSQSTVNGEPVNDKLSEDQKKAVRENLRNSGAEVIGQKGATVIAPVVAISSMVEAILNDKKEVMPCSVHLEGDYGHEGICIGVPARLGKEGLEGVVELDITDEERAYFNGSAKKIKGVVKELNL